MNLGLIALILQLQTNAASTQTPVIKTPLFRPKQGMFYFKKDDWTLELIETFVYLLNTVDNEKKLIITHIKE